MNIVKPCVVCFCTNRFLLRINTIPSVAVTSCSMNVVKLIGSQLAETARELAYINAPKAKKLIRSEHKTRSQTVVMKYGPVTCNITNQVTLEVSFREMDGS